MSNNAQEREKDDVTLKEVNDNLRKFVLISRRIEQNTAFTAAATAKTEYNTRGILFHWVLPLTIAFSAYISHEVAVRTLPAQHPYAQFSDQVDSSFRMWVKSLVVKQTAFKVWALPRPKGKDISKLHPHLQNAILYATQLAKADGYTFYITSAARTRYKQNQLIKAGKTDTKNSRHLTDLHGVAYAVDITLYASSSPQREKYALINRYMQTSAKNIGTHITWGGTYTAYDGVHYTLNKKRYRRNTYKPYTTNYPRFDQEQLQVMRRELMRTESSGDHVAVNPYGYLGLYQFGLAALCEVGGFIKKPICEKKIPSTQQAPYLTHANNWLIKGGQDTFLSSKPLQERAFQNLLNRNIVFLTDKGVLSPNTGPVQLACVSKAAWLGPKKAIRYFKYGKHEVDSNGTSLAVYCKQAKTAMRKHLRATGTGYEFK